MKNDKRKIRIVTDKGAGMQDDQTKSVDGLTLAGNPSQSDGSVPADPALQALEEKQSEQVSDTPLSSDTAATPPPVEGEPPAPPAGSPPEPPTDTNTSNTAGDLSGLEPIKKEALKKLEPLVTELDLPAEEKYRALMMIIQATDNKDLVNEAYQAADKIEDNKTRAQALLSIVNEIEYFKNKEIASSD